MKQEELKKVVHDKYNALAEGQGGSCCSTNDVMSDSYTSLAGYAPDADLGLGCGLPTAFAQIKKGDVVVDLGSGAGNDAFIARHETGEAGKVIGVDFAPAMVARARENAAKLGFSNVHFMEGDIENMPLADDTADVVVSNCVLNLVPDKQQVFQEIFRILRPGGHFSISDIVTEGHLPAAILNSATCYAGCVSGAIQKNAYLEFISQAGFSDITVQKEKPIEIPDSYFRQNLSAEAYDTLPSAKGALYSITVFGRKPL